MRKGLALMPGILLMFSLTACGTKTSQPGEIETAGNDGLTMTEEATADTELEPSEPNEESAEENSGNILIAYFSRWGNTEYPDDVDATTFASIVTDGENYGTTEVPQAVLSFLNEYDLSGKTVVPFCTHDGYGAGGSYGTIREASHAAESPEGLAIEAKDISAAKNTVSAWLEEISAFCGCHSDWQSDFGLIRF